MYALRQVTNMAQARLDFSIAPENWWERKLKFPFGNAYIQGRLLLVLRRVYIYLYIHLSVIPNPYSTFEPHRHKPSASIPLVKP